jgi:hypothetical protein
MSKKQTSKPVKKPVVKKQNKQATDNRPKFSIEVFDSICEALSTSSIGLNKSCKNHSVSPTSFYAWIKEDSELLNKYTRARENQADFMADEIIEIADDKSGDNISTENGTIANNEFINRSRLRVEARKWIAAKLKPKKYGDKLDVTTDGEKVNQPIIIDWSKDGDK